MRGGYVLWNTDDPIVRTPVEVNHTYRAEVIGIGGGWHELRTINGTSRDLSLTEASDIVLSSFGASPADHQFLLVGPGMLLHWHQVSPRLVEATVRPASARLKKSRWLEQQAVGREISDEG